MKKTLFIVLYSLTPIILTLVIYQVNPDNYQSLWSISSMAFGTVAYAWIQWQFILSSRPKWLEKSIGMDYIYRFHGMMALVTIGLGFIHGQLKEQIYPDNFMTTMGSGALIIFGGISILSILVMVTSRLHDIKIIRQMKARLQKVRWFKYEQLKKYHNLTVIGQVMVVVHVLMTAQVRQSILSFGVYMAFFLIAFGHYIFHKIYRTWLLMEHPLVVEKVEKVAINQDDELPKYMWHVYLKSTKGHVQYEPGQFAFFRFHHNGELEEHPFSIASSPTESSLSISVKQLGDFSDDLGGLQVDSQLVMDGPYGTFSYKLYKKEEGIVFFAAGIGITPAIGMIRHMRVLNESRPITLIWQLKSMDEAVFLKELSIYQEEMQNLNIQLLTEHIKGSYIHQLVEEARTNKNSYGYYICGPSGYMTMVKSYLTGAGVRRKYIHSESFSF